LGFTHGGRKLKEESSKLKVLYKGEGGRSSKIKVEPEGYA
jgi:hypothetical protein